MQSPPQTSCKPPPHHTPRCTHRPWHYLQTPLQSVIANHTATLALSSIAYYCLIISMPYTLLQVKVIRIQLYQVREQRQNALLVV